MRRGSDVSWRLYANLLCLLCATQVYWWHEKYRPRRPKYFNRVHTGYEWNKYNQTHYDADNPPPKTVQVRNRTPGVQESIRSWHEGPGFAASKLWQAPLQHTWRQQRARQQECSGVIPCWPHA